MSYTPTIGLEVHAELNTKSKMFCGCENKPHHSEPNANICPVCLAHPGTLPVPNVEAIKMVLLFGQAVGATPASFSEFDRKNYFYPDIPKAYQISQYAYPFLTAGELEGVQLTRVHLEEDTARSQHDKGAGSLVDFNRAGVPLMELVTEPVIHDASTAGKFARELQLILKTIGISQANMERGEMRVEANISVSNVDGKFGTKVEVKNLNSFKSVEGAIEYEVERQIEELEKGKVIKQETRGWDENRSKTFTQRSKETAKDYRYFPDPDITKISIDEYGPFDASRLAEKIVSLPSKKRLDYKKLGLTRDLIETIISHTELDTYFTGLLKLTSSPAVLKLAANYLTSDIIPILSETDLVFTDLKKEHFIELMTLVLDKKIGSRVAKDLLKDLFSSAIGPFKLAEQKGLLQVSDENALLPVINEILQENETVVADYKAGKEASLQYLLGQGMKKTKGAGDPTMLKKILLEALK